MKNRRQFSIGLISAAACGLAPRYGIAQGYPTRTIRMLVGFGAGGSADLVARQLAQLMSTSLGQPVVVDNKTGAGGNIATAELARSAPDGYTLMLASPGQLVVNPLTQKSIGFDPKTAFTPIGLVSSSPLALVVPASSPFRTAAEFLAYGRKNPGKLNYASPGIGTSMHIGAEMLNTAAGMETVHVPYRGGGQSNGELIAGRIDYMIDLVGAITAGIDAGQLRVLAVGTPQRLARFPEAPTLSELVGDYELTSWAGLIAPPNLPTAVSNALSAALANAIKDARLRDLIVGRGGVQPDASAPFFAAHLERERRRVERTVVRAGLRLD